MRGRGGIVTPIEVEPFSVSLSALLVRGAGSVVGVSRGRATCRIQDVSLDLAGRGSVAWLVPATAAIVVPGVIAAGSGLMATDAANRANADYMRKRMEDEWLSGLD